jgi:hypothetical protein
VTSKSRALFIVVTVATVAALVWLPALFGFSGAVGLASLWCWLLDEQPGPSPSEQSKGNI